MKQFYNMWNNYTNRINAQINIVYIYQFYSQWKVKVVTYYSNKQFVVNETVHKLKEAIKRNVIDTFTMINSHLQRWIVQTKSCSQENVRHGSWQWNIRWWREKRIKSGMSEIPNIIQTWITLDNYNKFQSSLVELTQIYLNKVPNYWYTNYWSLWIIYQ